MTAQPKIHMQQLSIFALGVISGMIHIIRFTIVCDSVSGWGTKLCHSMTRQSQLPYYTHNVQTVKLVYWFSDRLYGLIIPCGPTGTADHIITLRIQSHQLSRFYFKKKKKVKSSEGRVFQLNWLNRSCINISIKQRTLSIIMFPVKYEFVKYGRVSIFRELNVICFSE